MIGFYPLSNTTTISENVTVISSFFASASQTVATNLPNSLLSTPSASTASYIFNTSVPASLGQLVSSELGASTYSPILAGAPTAVINASAIPLITPPPTALTLVVTDASGMLSTTVEAVATSSIQLGLASSATGVSSPLSALILACLSLGMLLWFV